MLEYVRQEARESQSRIDEHGLLRAGRVVRPWLEASGRRADERVGIVDRVHATIFLGKPQSGPDSGHAKLVREGVTRNLSPNGTCILLENGLEGVAVDEVMGQTAKVRIEFEEGGQPRQVNALGRIAWGKEQDSGVILGLQFMEIPESERKVLELHCAPEACEQILLFQLWETEVSKRVGQENNER